MGWPQTPGELAEVQHALAGADLPVWEPPAQFDVGGCFVCWERGPAGPGEVGDRGWAAAALGDGVATAEGRAPAGYTPGLLALREGALLEAAVRRLPRAPDVLLVDATGRDHPRRAGLAVHLGAVLGLPTVGLTHRPLLATGEWPDDIAGATSPLELDGEQVGCWLRTRAGRRPLAVHAGWRTDSDMAAVVVARALGAFRTPEPLRFARRAARSARVEAIPRVGGER
jgi:deoxyribonuclease V